MLKSKHLLLHEKLTVIRYIKWRATPLPEGDKNVSGKNAEKSVLSRKAGNAIYTSDLHNIDNYEKIWLLYSESIAFAPINSEELALGYGNRSAFLLHVNAYKECIADCDIALNITSSDYLKLKLLRRKAQSLAKLEKSTKEVCEEALQLLHKLNLKKKLKNNYKTELNELYNSRISTKDENKISKIKIFYDNLRKFERSEEVPCASKSVAIQYNEEWGRHVVATEDIKPGEIIAVDKNCLNFPLGLNKYEYCGNCMQYLFLRSSVPCEYCSYTVYCSVTCRKAAWEKYHQFECPIIVLENFNESVIDVLSYPLRMCLLGVYQAGGLKRMKEQLLEIENSDPREKGFLNGILEEGKVRSILGLEHAEHSDDDTQWLYVGVSCLAAYLLANYTNFFGKRMNVSQSKMFHNNDILFTAALLLRCINTMNICGGKVTHSTDSEAEVKRFYQGTFTKLFNHSCDPNIAHCPTEYCEDLYYARYPIKKGSQLFTAYDHNIFNLKPKECRQKDLSFICKCIACTKNWSSICLPSLKIASEITPSLRSAIPLNIIRKVKNECSDDAKWSRILFYLELLSKKFTVYCQEYFTLLDFLKDIYTYPMEFF